MKTAGLTKFRGLLRWRLIQGPWVTFLGRGALLRLQKVVRPLLWARATLDPHSVQRARAARRVHDLHATGTGS
jgi:hypothetical protein